MFLGLIIFMAISDGTGMKGKGAEGKRLLKLLKIHGEFSTSEKKGINKVSIIQWIADCWGS